MKINVGIELEKIKYLNFEKEIRKEITKREINEKKEKIILKQVKKNIIKKDLYLCEKVCRER